MKDCLFCKIAEGTISCKRVYETKDFLAVIDIRPVNMGHVLVFPKIHCKDALDFPLAQETEFFEVVKKVSAAVVKAVNADAFNLGMNNGQAAGQTIFHAHMHIIPRFYGDGLELWHAREGVEQEELEKIHAKIKEHL
jgi:histidine triad (HIT) family protein